MANEVKYRPATMAEIEERDTDLYMNGERVWVFMINRSQTIGEDDAKLIDIVLTNMKHVQPEDLQVIDETLKEQDELSESPMMKQYRDLKSKHPEAMLLFRCGDFYETYEDDAKECAKVLGITLTKRQSDGVAMAGFPHHALDTYLPKLIRTGHRIAICDQLDPPPGPKRKRGETKDKAAIKREQSDACIDSAEREQAQTKFNNSNNNQNKEVMTNETMKVADLIGKSVCNGNAKYVIKSVDGDKVTVDFAMGDNAAKEMNMKAEQIEKLLQGGWQVSDGEKKADGGSQKAEEPKAKKKADGGSQKAEEPKAKKKADGGSQKAEEPKAEKKADGGSQKAKTVKMEPEPKPKAEEQEKVSSSKFQVSSNGAQPTPETCNVKPETKAGTLTYSTYTNKKGKACAKISGFAETDAAYQQAVSLHGSATYENTKQGRVNFLLFGPRYAEVAKTVCQMLNEGKAVADCQAVVDAATEERQQKREERKQKREAYRQEHEGRSHQTSSGKVYTEAEVADLMRRVIEGDKEAIAIVNAMAA